MRIKYIIISSQEYGGVNKKLFGQALALRQLGLDVELIFVSVGNVQYPSYEFLIVHRLNKIPMHDFFGRIRRAREISMILGNEIDSLDTGDVLYCRYFGSFSLYYPRKYIRCFRICRIVTEHQTKELDEIKLTNNPLAYWSEFLFGKLLRKQSDAIVGVTDEITQYEIARAGDPEKPHLTVGNGFAVRSVPVRQAPDYNGEDLHILCVASVSRWHGLDRLLQGIATYRNTPKVTFHIGGDGAELLKLSQLAGDLGISDRVVFHGFLSGESLDAAFEMCHIAVGSLGIHRKGLIQTSELKGREYCARGIPYIIACTDPDFSADFPYIFRFPADESPIDIDQVVAFARRVLAEPDHPEKMRRYAEEHLDWSVKMKKLKGFLEKLVEQER